MSQKNKAAQSLGSLGGKARAKKYTKQELSEMGKKGGRPRKETEDTRQERIVRESAKDPRVGY